MKEIEVIAGGMGFGISSFRLVNTVSRLGEKVLGTLSGVAPEILVTRLLQQGDVGGNIQRAFRQFPFPEIAERVYRTYFVPGGIPQGAAYQRVEKYSLNPSRDLIDLTICANFALVWLAKEGHENPVSINFLEKIALPHLFNFFGAMLAGVDFMSMGAGIPIQVPGILDAFSEGLASSYHIPVDGCKTSAVMHFDPKQHFGATFPELKRPAFLPIVSSNQLADILMKRKTGSIEGIVVELPTAGGHNAPPKGTLVTDSEGNPIYGERDQVDWEKIAGLGVPFWIGGSQSSPGSIAKAQALGANGIQVGSIFALCDESGMDMRLKERTRRQAFRDELKIITSIDASPTGFPFKVACLDGTLSDDSVHDSLPRTCEHGCLVSLCQKANGEIGCHCSALNSPKTGKNRTCCMCRGLIATASLGNEPPIVTLGDDLGFLKHLIKTENDSYTAKQALDYLFRNHPS